MWSRCIDARAGVLEVVRGRTAIIEVDVYHPQDWQEKKDVMAFKARLHLLDVFHDADLV